MGKSHLARENFPDAYIKGLTEYWNGYQGQEVVILEDIDPFHVSLGSHLKYWADRYRFSANIKLVDVVTIRPKLFIVTSQYTIDQIWKDEETILALERRFTTLHYVDRKEDYAILVPFVERLNPRNWTGYCKSFPHLNWKTLEGVQEVTIEDQTGIYMGLV